jgi:hypothetical protein
MIRLPFTGSIDTGFARHVVFRVPFENSVVQIVFTNSTSLHLFFLLNSLAIFLSAF